MNKARMSLAALTLAAMSLGFDALASADGDTAKGATVFAKCKACHTLEAGKNRIGPSLQGVIGRTAGTVEGFNYSDGMKAAGAAGVVWSDDTLDKYLTMPKQFVPGNKMPFPGLPKAEDRANVIAYIKSQMQ